MNITLLDPELEALIGTTVGGKYRVDEPIGRGGMGAVVRATNTAIGKRVALKFLYRDAARDRDAVTRFQREAEAASAVESAHIVEIFDSGTTDEGLPFLVMELLKGEDLRARLRREGRISVPDAVHIGGQVARALRRAHEAGIVHRDLKPDNVFLCRRDDDPMFVKLVDFGISKVTRKAPGLDTLTRKGLVLGTAFYMSPEQAQAKPDVDGRTDLFSLGAILFEALTGRPPHTGQAYEAVLIAICTKDAPDVRDLVPDVPAALARVISKALERDREERFQTADEFYDALAAAVPGLLNTGSQPSEPLLAVAGLTPQLNASETAENAAVAPAPTSGAGLQARRTIVTGVVAALAAFTITVVLMARSSSETSSDSGSAAAAPSQPALASSTQSPQIHPEPERTEPVPTSSSSADAPPAPAESAVRSTLPAKGPTRATHPPTPRNPPSKQPPPSPRPPAKGVANGLELATEP